MKISTRNQTLVVVVFLCAVLAAKAFSKARSVCQHTGVIQGIILLHLGSKVFAFLYQQICLSRGIETFERNCISVEAHFYPTTSIYRSNVLYYNVVSIVVRKSEGLFSSGLSDCTVQKTVSHGRWPKKCIICIISFCLCLPFQNRNSKITLLQVSNIFATSCCFQIPQIWYSK